MTSSPSELQDALHAELRACLTASGLSQAEVARRTGISAKHLQDAKDAAVSEGRLLGLLAIEVDVLGASPLQAARRLFGGSRA